MITIALQYAGAVPTPIDAMTPDQAFVIDDEHRNNRRIILNATVPAEVTRGSCQCDGAKYGERHPRRNADAHSAA
jgi:hypothetical protein